MAFQSPAGAERWAKTQTIRWNATDPDNDTLTYELFYSDDGGASSGYNVVMVRLEFVIDSWKSVRADTIHAVEDLW